MRMAGEGIPPEDLLILQAVKELIARVFRLQTDVSRLRADVNRIGGPRDTMDLRHKVCSSLKCIYGLFQV